MTDNDIIQEATEAVTKGLPCAFLVQPLLDVVKRQKAEIERYLHSIKLLEKDVAQAKSEAYMEFAHMVVDKAQKGIIYAMDIPDYVVELTESNE